MDLRRILAVSVVVLVALSTVPTQAEGNDLHTVAVGVHWVDDGQGGLLHQYTLQFNGDGAYTFEARFSSDLVNGTLEPTAVSWDSNDAGRVALVTFDHSLSWGESANVRVNLTAVDGTPLTSPVHAERHLQVGQWNQPMDDHEVLLSTRWSTEQAYTNEEGPQRFALSFDGQGWQQRIGEVVQSWELGTGDFETFEQVNGTATDLDLVLTQLWKNETVVAGVLTAQTFDARGFGTLNTTVDQDGVLTVIHANVSQAELNRSTVDGVIEEQLLLEATGVLNLSDNSASNDSLAIDGELAVFFLEYHDVDGERVLQHTQFEAMATFVLIEDGTRLDVDLDGFSSLERWVNGERVQQHEELYGSGTFGFSDQDENASLQVNGTILDLHTQVINGSTMIDDLHVDGVLTGDVQGTFGVVRGIEETGTQANATGEVFDVNVIHQETWFNITGLNGGNFFDGAGLGATHNETWDYQVVHADWDNRTVRLVWRETGADASEGDERPERSPIQQDPTPPEVDQSLGNLTVSRETGWMPIPLQSGDRLTLNAQTGLVLDVTAGEPGVDVRDGHNLSVVRWSGVYGMDGTGAQGTANGAIVADGPLQGLLSSVQRTLSVPFGPTNDTLLLNETQALDRVISPQIVSADDNTAPMVTSVSLREGLVVGESGSLAHLEVVIADAEFNVDAVTVDLGSMGLGTVTLNDRGLDGDQTIGDDVYTVSFRVPGLEVGVQDITVVATDAFDARTTHNGTIEVVNHAPRLLGVTLAPETLERGASLVVNVRAYDGHGVASVGLDLRPYGGTNVSLTENDGTWAAMVDTPEGLSPGLQTLTVVVMDGEGASARYVAWSPPTGEVGASPLGPHHVPVSGSNSIALMVLNDRPSILSPPTVNVVKVEGASPVFTVNVSDPDGVYRVEANLGVFAGVGADEWVTMHDDGRSGGDEVAGDGVFSVALSVRSGTPLGTHEITVRAVDAYGEQNTASAAVNLVDEDESEGAGLGSSSLLMGALGVLVLLGAAAAVVFMMRSGGQGGRGGDRFGME